MPAEVNRARGRADTSGMNVRYHFGIAIAVISLLILLASAPSADAAPLDMTPYRGTWALIVYATDNDDPRPFEANLAISTEWNRFDARGVEIVDVYPGRHDVDAVGAQFAVAPSPFAMILVDPDGTVELVQRERQDIGELLRAIDLWKGTAKTD